ncbi:hypothetical protein ABC733_17010 [Mangrovibacter sp. SLW1]
MFKFNMTLQQNFASFFNEDKSQCVLVDSYDNQEFDVRMGTIEHSEHIGTVHAASDEELNKKLERMMAEHV